VITEQSYFSRAGLNDDTVWTIVLLFVELDVRCEACQRFFKEGLTTSFIKILTDEAVSGWKMEIHVSLTSVLSYYQVTYSSSCPVQLKIQKTLS